MTRRHRSSAKTSWLGSTGYQGRHRRPRSRGRALTAAGVALLAALGVTAAYVGSGTAGKSAISQVVPSMLESTSDDAVGTAVGGWPGLHLDQAQKIAAWDHESQHAVLQGDPGTWTGASKSNAAMRVHDSHEYIRAQTHNARRPGSASIAGFCAQGTQRQLPDPGDVYVNVLNSTTRYKLAANTAWQLAERGFGIGSISNDPFRRSLPHEASVYFGKAGREGARLLQAHVKGARLVKDQREDSSIDLVLGWEYTTLVNSGQVRKATEVYQQKQKPSC